jgi:hypothetical protein
MKIKYTPTFAEKVRFGKLDNVMTYFGKNGLGKDFFCYIRCGLEGYKTMLEDFDNKITANPAVYGDIIYKDFIAEPDEKAKNFLEKWLAENKQSSAS